LDFFDFFCEIFDSVFKTNHFFFFVDLFDLLKFFVKLFFLMLFEFHFIFNFLNFLNFCLFLLEFKINFFVLIFLGFKLSVSLFICGILGQDGVFIIEKTTWKCTFWIGDITFKVDTFTSFSDDVVKCYSFSNFCTWTNKSSPEYILHRF